MLWWETFFNSSFIYKIKYLSFLVAKLDPGALFPFSSLLFMIFFLIVVHTTLRSPDPQEELEAAGLMKTRLNWEPSNTLTGMQGEQSLPR